MYKFTFHGPVALDIAQKRRLLLVGLKLVRFSGILLLSIGSLIFFSWLFFLALWNYASFQNSALFDLPMCGFFYLVFAIPCGLILAVVYLVLSLVYHFNKELFELKNRLNTAGLLLFVNIPVAVLYFFIYSKLVPPSMD